MRVAMLAPISHRVPPAGYGPWEQVASDLSNGLTTAGHEVTLFAPQGSETMATLEATAPHAIEDWPEEDPPPDPRVWEEIHIATMADHVAEGGFDIVHSHLGVHVFGYARLLGTPLVTTLHGSAWNRRIHPALARYRDLPFVSLSASERRLFPDLNYVATVHNGIDTGLFRFEEEVGGFLLFAGRMAPEKRPEVAIEVARRAGIPLKLVGPTQPEHSDFFASQVAPLLDPPNVEYLGAVTRTEMIDLYPEAAALVMPLGWDEPFGLVVIEALASGTPVVAWRRGAMPELITDGVTGALVEDVEAAVSAVTAIEQIDRKECRRGAETRFDIETMTRGYVAAYRSVVDSDHLVE